ncbi:hypothetical protein [Mycolicibacterium sp. CBMA 226]|uniref:hypothetical protein n=1 Tax=Mycolicibacterium sp. CBMA 226 TaxID=2606611 RepID=UPI001AA13C5C
MAARLDWRPLLFVTWTTAFAWAFALAMIEGWQLGFAGRLTAPPEYLRQVPTITDIPTALQTFASRTHDFQPNSWITHVSAHPPVTLDLGDLASVRHCDAQCADLLAAAATSALRPANGYNPGNIGDVGCHTEAEPASSPLSLTAWDPPTSPYFWTKPSPH